MRCCATSDLNSLPPLLSMTKGVIVIAATDIADILLKAGHCTAEAVGRWLLAAFPKVPIVTGAQ
jgi:hypothetical protein